MVTAESTLQQPKQQMRNAVSKGPPLTYFRFAGDIIYYVFIFRVLVESHLIRNKLWFIKLCRLLLSPASVANSASIAHQGIATHASPRLRYESGRSLQRSPVRVLFLSPRQASVRVELGRSAGPEHPQVQQHISCHPRRASLASNQEKDRLQDGPFGPTLLGWCCAGIPDGTVPSCWLSRRSTMSPVGFSW